MAMEENTRPHWVCAAGPSVTDAGYELTPPLAQLGEQLSTFRVPDPVAPAALQADHVTPVMELEPSWTRAKAVGRTAP